MKQQVLEKRESRAATEKAAAYIAEAQQKRHEETLNKQHVETMQMSAWLMEKQSGQEQQKQRDEQVHEAPVASDGVENPASTSQDLHGAADSAVSVEVAPREDQSNESGHDRDYGPYGESANTHGDQRPSIPTMKMAPPALKERKGFQAFLQRVKVCSKYYGFESVPKSEPHIDVGSIPRNV